MKVASLQYGVLECLGNILPGSRLRFSDGILPSWLFMLRLGGVRAFPVAESEFLAGTDCGGTLTFK